MTDEECVRTLAEFMGRPAPHWWCDMCGMTKSPVQVTFEENCTKCGLAVRWVEDESYLTSYDALAPVWRKVTALWYAGGTEAVDAKRLNRAMGNIAQAFADKEKCDVVEIDLTLNDMFEVPARDHAHALATAIQEAKR